VVGRGTANGVATDDFSYKLYVEKQPALHPIEWKDVVLDETGDSSAAATVESSLVVLKSVLAL